MEKPDDHTSLSDNMYVLTLLAFYFHQIFELTDKQFQDCRVAYGSKQQLWGILRVKVRFLLFDSWEDLLDNLLSNPEPSEGYRYNIPCLKQNPHNFIWVTEDRLNKKTG
jgi:hypothetical protein